MYFCPDCLKDNFYNKIVSITPSCYMCEKDICLFCVNEDQYNELISVGTLQLYQPESNNITKQIPISQNLDHISQTNIETNFTDTDSSKVEKTLPDENLHNSDALDSTSNVTVSKTKKISIESIDSEIQINKSLKCQPIDKYFAKSSKQINVNKQSPELDSNITQENKSNLKILPGTPTNLIRRPKKVNESIDMIEEIENKLHTPSKSHKSNEKAIKPGSLLNELKISTVKKKRNKLIDKEIQFENSISCQSMGNYSNKSIIQRNDSNLQVLQEPSTNLSRSLGKTCRPTRNTGKPKNQLKGLEKRQKKLNKTEIPSGEILLKLEPCDNELELMCKSSVRNKKKTKTGKNPKKGSKTSTKISRNTTKINEKSKEVIRNYNKFINWLSLPVPMTSKMKVACFLALHLDLSRSNTVYRNRLDTARVAFAIFNGLVDRVEPEFVQSASYSLIEFLQQLIPNLEQIPDSEGNLDPKEIRDPKESLIEIDQYLPEPCKITTRFECENCHHMGCISQEIYSIDLPKECSSLELNQDRIEYKLQCNNCSISEGSRVQVWINEISSHLVLRCAFGGFYDELTRYTETWTIGSRCLQLVGVVEVSPNGATVNRYGSKATLEQFLLSHAIRQHSDTTDAPVDQLTLHFRDQTGWYSMSESNSLVVQATQCFKPIQSSNIHYLIYGNVFEQKSHFDQAAVDQLVDRFSQTNRHRVSLSSSLEFHSQQCKSSCRSSNRSRSKTSASLHSELSVSPQSSSRMILRSSARKTSSKYSDNFSQNQSGHGDDVECDELDQSRISDKESQHQPDAPGSPMEISLDQEDRSRISDKESYDQTNLPGSLLEISLDNEDQIRISDKESHDQTNLPGSLNKQDRTRSSQATPHYQQNQSESIGPSESSMIDFISVQHIASSPRSSTPDKLSSDQQDPKKKNSIYQQDQPRIGEKILPVQGNQSESPKKVSNDHQDSQFNPQQYLTTDIDPSHYRQMSNSQERSKLNQTGTSERISLPCSEIDPIKFQQVQITPTQPQYTEINIYRPQQIPYLPVHSQFAPINIYRHQQIPYLPIHSQCTPNIYRSQPVDCASATQQCSIMGNYRSNQMLCTPAHSECPVLDNYQLSQQSQYLPWPPKLVLPNQTSSTSTWSQSSSDSESNCSSRSASLHSQSTASQFSDETDSDVDMNRELESPSTSFYLSNIPVHMSDVRGSARRVKKAQLSSSGVSSISSSQEVAELHDWSHRPLSSFHSRSTPSQFSESGSEATSSRTRTQPLLRKRGCTIDDLIELKRLKTSQSNSQ